MRNQLLQFQGGAFALAGCAYAFKDFRSVFLLVGIGIALSVLTTWMKGKKKWENWFVLALLLLTAQAQAKIVCVGPSYAKGQVVEWNDQKYRVISIDQTIGTDGEDTFDQFHITFEQLGVPDNNHPILIKDAKSKKITLRGPKEALKIEHMQYPGPLIDPVTHTATPQDLKEAERLRAKEAVFFWPKIKWKVKVIQVRWQPMVVLESRKEPDQIEKVAEFFDTLEGWQLAQAKIVEHKVLDNYLYEYKIFYPVNTE